MPFDLSKCQKNGKKGNIFLKWKAELFINNVDISNSKKLHLIRKAEIGQIY